MPTGPPDLTETTVRYLFAASWLPSSDSEQLVAVGPEDDHGMRRLIRALDLDNRGPWKTVCNHCYMDEEEDLSMTVASDCLRVIADGFQPGGGDNL